jgi:hypothetical protein
MEDLYEPSPELRGAMCNLPPMGADVGDPKDLLEVDELWRGVIADCEHENIDQ